MQQEPGEKDKTNNHRTVSIAQTSAVRLGPASSAISLIKRDGLNISVPDDLVVQDGR